MIKWTLKHSLSMALALVVSGCLYQEKNDGIATSVQGEGAESTLQQDVQGKAFGLVVAMTDDADNLSDEQLINLSVLYGVQLTYVRPMANHMCLYEVSGLRDETSLIMLMEQISELPTVRFVEQDKSLKHR